ncbi:MAG: ATP-binding protein, partial [Opitutales bacterium]|nr:ATP-binding protein [Opitutales bacterium]
MNTLHIIAGLPASGKTTYGQSLARRLDAAFLDIDTTTEPIVK